MPPHPVVNFLSLWNALDEKAEDRTVAICCGAYLEDVLAQAISTKLPGANKDLLDKLFGDKGPINPAAGRIDLAKALGVIDGDDRHVLRCLVSIRNKFAHNIAIDSFDHPVPATQVDELQLTGPNKKEYDETYAPVKQSRRQRFMCIAMMVGVRLSNYVNSARGTGKIVRIKSRPED